MEQVFFMRATLFATNTRLRARSLAAVDNIGTFIISIGLWDSLYDKYNQEHQNSTGNYLGPYCVLFPKADWDDSVGTKRSTGVLPSPSAFEHLSGRHSLVVIVWPWELQVCYWNVGSGTEAWIITNIVPQGSLLLLHYTMSEDIPKCYWNYFHYWGKVPQNKYLFAYSPA